MGTSFAAPFALRSAAGIRAIPGEAVNPLTIKALLIHGATFNEHRDVNDVGWGRIPEDISAVITTGNGVARGHRDTDNATLGPTSLYGAFHPSPDDVGRHQGAGTSLSL